METIDTLIIGAGPAGLTTAYRLAKARHDVIVIEQDQHYVGGISRTVSYKGFLFDIGGHRFFSKSREVVGLWNEILPNDFLTRPRLSRIYYEGKFYAYPLKAFEALQNLGLAQSIACLASYVYARAFPLRDPKTFHQWMRNEFGERLFSIFFKTYTEKVWGTGCDEISADWAAQRIKGLNLSKALIDGLQRSLGLKPRTGAGAKTLIESFRYPRRGPGMMWEAAAKKTEALGCRIVMDRRCERLLFDPEQKVWTVETMSGDRTAEIFKARRIVSSAPIAELLASPLWRAAKNSWAMPLIALNVFLLSRPYRGIVQDAYIYTGRALADLDPNGVGRDFVFIHDGQFGFSLFRFMAKEIVALLGLAMAAKALAIVAALAWFFAAFALARQFASGRAAWVVVIFSALLPASYGASSFEFAELIATPFRRGFGAIWTRCACFKTRCYRTLLRDRGSSPASDYGACRFGVFVVVRGLDDKSWFLLCALAGSLLILAGALGASFLERFFTAIDPSLRSLYESRSSYLFPSHWPAESFSWLVVQVVTIAIAAKVQPGRPRRVLSGIMVVGVGGLVIAAIFGDWLSSLLVIQVQPWRSVWLLAATGAMALGICVINLWRRGPTERIVLAMLVLSWSLNTQLFVAGPNAILALSLDFGMQSFAAGAAAILALFLHLGAKRYSHFLTPPYVAGTWIFAVVIAASWNFHLFAHPWKFAIAAPAGNGNVDFVLVRNLLGFPLCALAVYFAGAKPRIWPLPETGLTVLLLATVVLRWDHRAPAQRLMEENHPPPEIAQLIDQQDGEVLWIDGFAEVWFALHRPQWASLLQGGPIIFSPVLAAEWQRRMRILMDLRLADQKSLMRWSTLESVDRPRLSEDGVRRLCGRDAPAWIIAALEHGTEPPARIEMGLWRLPVPQFKLTKGDGEYVWQKIDAYGVISCAGQARSQPS